MVLKNVAGTYILLALILSVALFAAPLPAYAQSPQVTAEVDRTDPTLYDIVTLTVTVTGENNIGAPDFPTLSGLQITGRKITSQQTFRNGRVTAEFKFIIEMQPRHTGAIEIGSVSVPIGGDTYETNPITLNVTQGVPPTPLPMPAQPLRPANSFLRPQGQPNQGDPSFQTGAADGTYFIESEVDNDNPYLGEQITYTSKFYSADPYFIRPIHRTPDFVGFWNPDRPDRREYPETIEGNGYRVVESTEILFPTIAGNITIEPGTVGVPGGAFSSSFTEYASPPIELRVRPLPSNEPPSFTGAVGQYEIEASLDSNDLVFGDSLTLTVEISGQGNFDTLPDPIWQDVPGWRAFENDSSHRTSVQDGTINGSKTFERVLIPDSPGDFELPPIEYSYFDPELDEYVTVSSDAFAIKVALDPNTVAAPDLSGAVDGSVTVADIRHIKPAPGGIGTPSSPTHVNPLIWGLGTLPIIALAILVVWRWALARRQALLIANAPIRARREALSRLTNLDPSASGADAATAALHGYLSVVLAQPSSSLQTSELKLRLQERGVSADTILRLDALIRDLDQLRFAPPKMVDGSAGSKAVADVVHRIEREIQI